MVAFSLYGSLNLKNSPNALHQKLLAIEDSISTQAGKKNFLKQSANLTKAVDPELVDLNSQIWGIARFDEPHNWWEFHPVIGWQKL